MQAALEQARQRFAAAEAGRRTEGATDRLVRDVPRRVPRSPVADGRDRQVEDVPRRHPSDESRQGFIGRERQLRPRPDLQKPMGGAPGGGPLALARIELAKKLIGDRRGPTAPMRVPRPHAPMFGTGVHGGATAPGLEPRARVRRPRRSGNRLLALG